MKKIDIQQFLIAKNDKFSIADFRTKVNDFYEDKIDYEKSLAEMHKQMDELQSLMYAHNRYGLLVILQAMDAAGKDGTLNAVFSGVNPQGLKCHSFKRPTETELEHDYLWRTNLQLPERGSITVFNRSYYEEVLITKVHPEIIKNNQRLPGELTDDMDKLFKNRYEDIKNMEAYLHRNGIRVVKLFLNVSKEEQGQRLIERIKDPSKNWKFDETDVKERGFWKAYQYAYEDLINATATEKCPWYVVPADDKKNMRLIVASIVIKELQKLKMAYPETTEAQQQALKKLIDIIQSQ
ncbi:PPK2 family polyphosphate kinase [Emticicia sp. TH156]|uniref:PPK2 family polyphosphate kinase n=1 Tax=Emticicia sp. TH156 TaxID=2067454 RepID=UPI000C772ADE|nr:PPK2 family polyphosphate kinase [Emticicia sp. TH156]PLK46418.1 phosphate--nucleotide phosphotransferase [Emticicia sp. TH156]